MIDLGYHQTIKQLLSVNGGFYSILSGFKDLLGESYCPKYILFEIY